MMVEGWNGTGVCSEVCDWLKLIVQDCEFEDVFRASVGGGGDGKANNKEIGDNEIRDERASDNDDASTDPDTSDNEFQPRGASDCGTRDEYDVPDNAPLDDASGENVGDRNPNDDEGETDQKPVTDDASMDNEAINFDPNDDTDAPSALDTTMVATNSWESVIAEIATLRDRLARA